MFRRSEYLPRARIRVPYSWSTANLRECLWSDRKSDRA